MEYRVIKNLNPGQKSWNHLYEMSKDGKSIRRISDKKEVPIELDGKAVLTNERGEVYTFGLKTLYRKSWGKALPDIEKIVIKTRKPKEAKRPLSKTALLKLERAKRKEERERIKAEKEAIKAEKAKRRNLKSSFKLKKGQLITTFALNALKEAEAYANKKGNRFIEFVGKNTYVKVILRKNGLWLIRVDGKSEARNGYWFLNPDTGKYTKFIEEIHKKGYGNEMIEWPSL